MTDLDHPAAETFDPVNDVAATDETQGKQRHQEVSTVTAATLHSKC